jgi:hypothetical protein
MGNSADNASNNNDVEIANIGHTDTTIKKITSKSIGARVTETQYIDMITRAKAEGLCNAHWLLRQLKNADLIDEVRKNLIEFRANQLERNENLIAVIDKCLDILK